MCSLSLALDSRFRGNDGTLFTALVLFLTRPYVLPMTDNNLFQEVQEDLERQKLEAMWKQYGGWVLAFALAVVLATAGMTAFRSWKAERDQRLTSGLLAATEPTADVAKNIAALQSFADQNPGTNQSAFALLKAGALAADQNDKTKAAQFFDAASADAKADDAFRQLGTLLSVQTQMDGGDANALSARLQPLTADHAPWRFSALEMQGYLALRAGDKDQARRILTILSQDASAPKTISARATDILRSLD